MFSGLEAAFLSVNNLRVRHLVEEKVKNAQLLKKLKDNPKDVIIALLIGNNIVNISASALATSIAINYSTAHGLPSATIVGIVTGTMTFIILLAGEIIPKTLAIKNGQKVCLKMAKVINFIVFILKPLIWIFKSITKIITGKESPDKSPSVTEEEIITFVNIGEQSGHIEADEKEMINNIFKLNDLEVKDIMTPKVNFTAVDADKKINELQTFFSDVNHSRIPVYDYRKNKFLGVCYVKDVIKLAFQNKTDVKVKELVKEPMYVPETKLIDELLREFQKEKKYIAFVVDEYGEVTGLITIEDLIEEIVGDIYDETDVEHKMIVKTEKNTFIIKGETPLHDIEKETGIDLENGSDITTLAGYINDEFGYIPDELENLDTARFNMTVLKMNGNRIIEVKMIVKVE